MKLVQKKEKPVKQKSPYTVMISAHVRPESLVYVHKLYKKMHDETGASMSYVVNKIIEDHMMGVENEKE